jgi:hypothetical protein
MISNFIFFFFLATGDLLSKKHPHPNLQGKGGFFNLRRSR